MKVRLSLVPQSGGITSVVSRAEWLADATNSQVVFSVACGRGWLALIDRKTLRMRASDQIDPNDHVYTVIYLGNLPARISLNFLWSRRYWQSRAAATEAHTDVVVFVGHSINSFTGNG
jgi:hypothetical protein